MATLINLIPAYGRDYKSKKAVLKDWEDGKDFIIAQFGDPGDGKPVNKPDAENLPPADYKIRYDGLKKLLIVKL